VARWQSELPGLGDSYQVDLAMLRGVAVDTSTAEGERFWKYLPVESLPSEPSAGFEVLFALKEKWLLEDLKPYLHRWVDGEPTDMLLRYTKIVTEDQDGVTVNLYTKA